MKILSLIGKSFLAFLLVWCFSHHIFGQTASDYSFSSSIGIYTPITTTNNSIVTGGVDSEASALINIGFTFNFAGVNYTQFSATTNGFVKLGSPAAGAYATTPLSTTAQIPAIAIMARDGKSGASGVKYVVAGTAPNRVLTVEYIDYQPQYNVTTTLITAQVKLYETSNVVEIVYGSCVGTTESYAGQVGIASSGTSFSNRTSTTSWSASSAGGSNTSTMTISGSVKPENGLTYRWTPSTCFAPSGIAASNLTTNSATVSWSVPAIVPANGYEYFISTSNTSPLPTTIGVIESGTSVSIPSLLPGTTYYVWVRSVCSASDFSAWSIPVQFSTVCSSETAPTVVENFTTMAAQIGVPAALPCWSEATSTSANSFLPTGTTSRWTNDDFANVTTPLNNSARINLYGTNIDWLISNPIDLGNTPNLYRLKYNYALTTYGSTSLVASFATHKVDVIISTDGGTTWTSANIIKTHSGANNTSLTQEIIDLTGYTGVVKFAFRATTTSNTPDLDFFIDNFVVELIPSCFEPSQLVSSNVATNSINISWTAPNALPANGYEYYYSTTNTAPTATTVGTAVTGTSTLITGLVENTTYYVWVRSVCDAADRSIWSSSTSFTTTCLAANVPYLLDFESVTTPALPSCTSVENLGTGNLWTTVSNPGYGFTSKTLRYLYNSSNAANTWFYTQGVNLTAGQSYRISYRYGKNSATYNELMKVAYGTSPNASSMTTVLNDHNPISNITAARSYVDFTPTTTGVYYFGFHAYSGANFNAIYVDDILVDYTPTCFSPTSLVSSDLTLTSGNVSWTAPTTAPANGYEYYYSTSNTAPTAATVASGVTANTSVSLSNLTASTNYYVWVRSLCSGTDVSEWSSEVNLFTGYCVPTGSTTYLISGVTTTNAVSNLAFTNTTSSVYLDRSTTQFTSYPGNTFNISITPSGSASQIYYMWVDWNNDLDFSDANEAIFSTTSGATSYSGVVTVPANQALGSYRVRVAMGTTGGTIPISPCASSYGRYVDFTLVVADAPSCIVPTATTVANVTSSSATISWTAPVQVPAEGYEYYYSTSNTAPTETTLGTAVTATSTPITGLAENTTYYVWVRSVCSTEDKSEWATRFTFFTGYCTPTSTSSYYLASITSNNALQNISFSQSSAQGYRDVTSTHVLSGYPAQEINVTLSPSSGTNYFYFWVDWNNDLDFSDAGETVVATTSYASSHNFILTIPANQPIGRYRVRAANSWTGNITSPCGPASYGTFVDFYLDVVSPPTCIVPTAFSVSGTTHSSSSVSWTAPIDAPAEGYEYYYSTTNTAPTETTTPSGSTEFTTVLLSDLNPTTTYYVWVRSVCSDTDVSIWANGGSFTTQCAPEVAPTTVQTFTSILDNVNTSLPCWSEGSSDVASPFVPTIANGNWSNQAFGNTGNNRAAYINIYRSNQISWLISNPIDLGAIPGRFRVKYDYKVTDYDETYLTEDAYGENVIDLIVSTDGGLTWSAANIIYSHSGVYNSGNQVVVDLANYSGVVKFGWRVLENNDIDIDIDFFVDNFVVEEIPCATPIVLSGGGVVCHDVTTLPTIDVELPFSGTWSLTYTDGTTPTTITGNTTTYSIQPTTSGTYSVVSSEGNCMATSTGQIVVDRLPEINVNNPQTICFGSSYEIGTSTYTESGTYTDILTSVIGGCDSTVTTVLTVLTENTRTQNVIICEGEVYTIGSNTYASTGTYIDVFTAILTGCDSTVTTNLTVTTIVPIVEQNNAAFLVEPIANATYQWINCNTNAVVASTENFVATENGEYRLRVTIGECSEETECYVVRGLAINSLEVFEVALYPNPTKSTVTINAKGAAIDKVEIMDVNGRLIDTIRLNGENPIVSLENYNNGVYLLQIHADGNYVVRRVTKQ